ncbi:MAG: 50S ribosomal protein L10 [Nanoarchaeota archaeon]|nr:50S ribosomal protein L10 [Nanoarchaeota archaeon]
MVAKKQTKKIERKVPESKLRAVDEIESLIKKNKTFMVCSIKGLPGKQFQEIKKKIRDRVKIKVVKKNIVLRAIEKSGIEIKKMEEHIKEDSALLFSNVDAFELSAILSENKTPVGAKTGQIAPSDIEIEPGPTELVPGPVISELGALGLKIAIENGKISIKEKKIIVRTGNAINDAAAGLMSKLDIKPFSVSFEPIAAYDATEHRVYTGIKIDKEESLEELKEAFSRALAFAVKMAYPCSQTISYLLGKAASHEKAILAKINTETKSEEMTSSRTLKGGVSNEP